MKRYFLFLFFIFFIYGCSEPQIEKEKSYATYINDEYLKLLDFKGSNLVASYINNQWYYIRKDGKAMLVIEDENGNIDRFQEGLARTKVNGKIGFFNRNLDIVIEPFYDYAFPFHNSISDICVGCKEVKNSDGSTMLDGGEWKRIDRSGLIIEE